MATMATKSTQTTFRDPAMFSTDSDRGLRPQALMVSTGGAVEQRPGGPGEQHHFCAVQAWHQHDDQTGGLRR